MRLKKTIERKELYSFNASGSQGDSFRENRPPGPPTKAFIYFFSGKNSAFKIEEVFAVPEEAKDLTLIIEKKPFEEVEARAEVNLTTTKNTSDNIIPEMEAFLAGLDGTGGTVGKLLKKYGVGGLDAKDMDLYNLKDGQIVKIYQDKDRVAYKVNIKSGLTTRSYKMHWQGGKIVAVDFLGLL